MIYIVLLMLMPVLITVAAFIMFRPVLEWKQCLATIGICACIVVGGYFFSVTSSTTDVEILSGRISRKGSVKVGCEHSYPCNCRTETTGSGSSQTTTTVCDTCYDHSFDIDWVLYTNIGKSIRIRRIDDQGLKTPPRWTAAFVGEPVALENYFVNYVKANPDSVLVRHNAVRVDGLPVPEPPVSVYDYYRVDRYLTVAFTDPGYQGMVWMLNELNANLGPLKQVNVVVVAAKTADERYSQAIEEKWLGGKKNDLVLILGVPEYPRIEWSHVMSWSRSEDMKVNIEEAVEEIGDLREKQKIIQVLDKEIREHWSRRQMKDFEYLAVSVRPSTRSMVTIFLISSSVAMLLSWFFYKTN